MSRIILITGWFDEYGRKGIKTDRKLFQVSHGIDEDTGKTVIINNEHPEHIEDTYFDTELGEWCIKNG